MLKTSWFQVGEVWRGRGGRWKQVVQTPCGNFIASFRLWIEKLVDQRRHFIGRWSYNVSPLIKIFLYTCKVDVFDRLDDIADLVLDHCVNNNIVKDDVRVFIKDAIMRKKHHQGQKNGHKNGEKSLIRSLTESSFTGSKSKYDGKGKLHVAVSSLPL